MINILLTIFVITVVFGTMLSALMLIGSSVYDLEAIREKRLPQKISKTRRLRYRPKVSMILPAFNEADVIVRSLDNLAKLRYKNIEIIVADDKSKDNTKQIVRDYIKMHPERNIILVAKRRNGGRGSAINAGLRRASGEIVVAYDPDCIVKPNAISTMVRHFADPDVSAVAANVRIMEDGTILGMIQKLEYLVSFRSKKFNTITNSEIIIGGAGASYRKSVLKKAGGFDDRMKTEDIELSMRLTRKLGKFGGLRYASDYVVYTEPVPTYKGLFRQRFRWKFGSLQALFFNRGLLFSIDRKQNPFLAWVRLPMAVWSELMLLLEPFYFVLFAYIAISKGNPLLFIGAATTFTFVSWLAIWSDEHLSIIEKLKLSSLAPFMYVGSFVMSLVQVSAMFRCLWNYKSVVGLRSVSGAYVTTQRSTQKLRIGA